MSDEKFDIVFTGQLAKGVEPAVAKRNMCALFKASAEKIDRMFQSDSVTLKKNLDIDAAGKYRIALKKAGVIVEVRQVVIKKEIKAVKPMGKAVFKVDDTEADTLPKATVTVVEGEVTEEEENALVENSDSDQNKVALKELTTTENAVAAKKANFESVDFEKVPLPTVEEKPDLTSAEVSQQSDNDDSVSKRPNSSGQVIELLPVGSDVLADDERPVIIPVSVDTSALSLKEMAGPLVEVTEIEYPETVALGALDFDLSEPAADVVPKEYRKTVPEPSFDLSHLALMEVGEVLTPQERDNNAESLPLIDVSHLSLAEV